MADPFHLIDSAGKTREELLREELLLSGQKDPFPKVEEVADGESEISVKTEVRELLDRHGREAYLRKRTDQRCRCRDPLTGEAEVDCPTCSGLGFVYLDHKIRTFKYAVTRQVSGAYRKEVAAFGVLGVDETVYYVATEGVRPSIHDWVVEVITDELGKVLPPAKIERAVDVNDVVDLRENYGTVSYWALRCRSVAIGK